MEAAVEKGTWQVQEVKSRLSHVLENAQKFGPQIITKHGKKVAVILSYEDYTRHRRAHSSLVDFFAGSPSRESTWTISDKRILQGKWCCEILAGHLRTFELLKAVPAPPVVDWIAAQEEVDLCISVLTLGEIHKGAQKVSDPTRRMKIRRWLEKDLTERFYGRILPIDIQVARVWGTVQAMAEANGRPLPAIDG